MTKYLDSVLEVLVIDDEPENKTIVKNILEGSGLSVTWCKNWNETKALLLERIKEGEVFPDVILVDMFFADDHKILGSNPGMEGLLIIKEIFKTFEGYKLIPPPVIGFTGYLSYLEPELIIEYGANDFITEDEYKRPNHFTRRLIRSVMEAKFESSFSQTRKKNIQEIEERIVDKALRHRNNDLKQAASFLRWRFSDVEKVAERLKNKRVLL